MSGKDPSIPDGNRLDSRDVIEANDDLHGEGREPNALRQDNHPESDGTIALDIEGSGEIPRAESSAIENSSDSHRGQPNDDDKTLPPLGSELAANPTVETDTRDENAATIIEPSDAVLDSQADVATIIDSANVAAGDQDWSAQTGDAAEFPSAVTELFPDSVTSQPTGSSEPGTAAPPPTDGTIVLDEPDETAHFDRDAGSSEKSGQKPESASSTKDDTWSSQPPESAKLSGRISSGETTNRYRLIENFAHGGMGNIWRAEDERIRREVAYKELLPEILNNREMVERFLEEAQVTGQLEHPGIVPVYELGRDSKGAPFYAMKLVRGTTMRDAIKAYHALPSDEGVRHLAFVKLLRNLIDVCHAVAFAHERGVLHRDLKPANVMLGDFGETMVLDWGLAKLIDPLESAADDEGTIGSLSLSDLTKSVDSTGSNETMPGTHAHDPSHSGSQTAMTVDSILGSSQQSTRHSVKTDVRSRGTETLAGAILGTPHYMSPEQAQTRNSKLDARSDIYSLGAILYEILTAKRPVEKDRLRKMLKQIVEGRIIPPRQHLSSIPKPIEAVCMKALSRKPKDRYQTAHQLVADVEAFLADEPVSVYEEPMQVRLRRWSRKHRTLVSSCAAAALMAAALFAVWRGVDNYQIAGKRQDVEAKLAATTQAIELEEFRRAGTLLAKAKLICDSDAALSDVKPGIAAVERARIDRWQLKIREILATADASFDAGDFGAAQATYTKVVEMIIDEPALEGIQQAAQLKLQEVVGAVKNEKLKQAALAKFQQFENDVDEARIHGSLINGDAVDQDLREAQKFAKSALAKYELEGPNPLSKPVPVLSAAQQESVRDEGYEMLLLLAWTDEILARLADPEQQKLSAERSLDYVDQAERLGLRTRIGTLLRVSYLEALGRMKDAKDALEVAEAIPNEKAIDYYLLADYMRMKGDFEGAISEYRHALQIDPGHFNSLFLTGLCHLKLGEDDAAVSYYSSCISLNPDFVWSHVGRGTAFARLKQFESAEEDFKRALKIKPKLFAIYTTRGSMYADRHKFDEAIADLQHAMTLRPRHAAPHVLLGETYYIQAKEIEKLQGKFAALAVFQKAKEELDTASDLDFNIPRIYRIRGDVNRRLEDLDAALGDFVIALRLEREEERWWRADYHVQIGNIYLSDEKRFTEGLQRALREYDAAIAIYDEEPLVHRLRGEVLLKLERFSEAVEAFTKFLGMSEPVADVYRARSEAYAKLSSIHRARSADLREQGRMRESDNEKRESIKHDRNSINDLTRSLEMEPSAKMLTRRAWAYLLRFESLAEKDFEDAVKQNPDDADSYFGLAYARVLQGNVEGAADAVRDGVKRAETQFEEQGSTMKTWGLFFNASTVFAQAVRQVEKMPQLSAEEKTQQIDKHAREAIKLLERAKTVAGPQFAAILSQSVNSERTLDPIRNRPEFQQLFPDVPSSK